MADKWGRAPPAFRNVEVIQMSNPFRSFYESYFIKDHLTNPNIVAGDYSYYSGFYHGRHFEENVWYLDPQRQGVDRLLIGKFCSIASGATFVLGGNQGHRADWITAFPFYWLPSLEISDSLDGFEGKGDTVVGNDVWIGAEALILPGVRIGDGAVIGARAVVSRDVSPYAIVVGNPAKEVRKRFSERQVEILLRVRWWDWDLEQIRRHARLLSSGNVEALASVGERSACQTGKKQARMRIGLFSSRRLGRPERSDDLGKHRRRHLENEGGSLGRPETRAGADSASAVCRHAGVCGYPDLHGGPDLSDARRPESGQG
jgi:chloramphenicol O-acetyltransferase type B